MAEVDQLTLFGRGAPALARDLGEARRVALDAGAWLDHLPGWIAGHAALMEALRVGTGWREESRRMFNRTVAVPRLVASLPEDGPGHPLVPRMRAALERRYGQDLSAVGLALYRDGRDSVAWHGDRIARHLAEAIVVTVSLGSPRRFLVRPRGGGRSLSFQLGAGDLMVMGGSSQRTWEHAIPKVAQALPRMVVVFRPVWTAATGRSGGSPGRPAAG